MKVLISTSKNVASFQLAFLLKNDEIIFGDDFDDYPQADSNSLAHQILKFCLDHEIGQIFPLKFPEYQALLNSQILFEEFGIEVMLGAVGLEDVDEYAKAGHSFTELSSGLIALGYPNQGIAFGNAEKRGELIVIDDQTKERFQIWNQIETLNFSQLGKWFNQTDFYALHLYKFGSPLLQFYVMIYHDEIRSVIPIAQAVKEQLNEINKKRQLKGFYHMAVADQKVLRFTHAKI